MAQWPMSAPLPVQLQSRHEPWKDRGTARTVEPKLRSQGHKQTSLDRLEFPVKLVVFSAGCIPHPQRQLLQVTRPDAEIQVLLRYAKKSSREILRTSSGEERDTTLCPHLKFCCTYECHRLKQKQFSPSYHNLQESKAGHIGQNTQVPLYRNTLLPLTCKKL